MHNIIVIYGEIAVHAAQEGDFKKALDEIDSGGDIKSYSFKTQAESDAFQLGLYDSNGWSDYYMAEPDEIKQIQLTSKLRGIKL